MADPKKKGVEIVVPRKPRISKAAKKPEVAWPKEKTQPVPLKKEEESSLMPDPWYKRFLRRFR